DNDIRRLITESLRSAGLDVVAAVDASQALRTALARKPAAVVLDIGLPDYDGTQFVPRWRERRPDAGDVPIVIVSGRADRRASAGTAGMQELGRRFAAAQPDVSIVLTPHNIHVEGAMAVIDAAAVSGDLVQWGSAISLRIPVDRELALAVRDAIREDGVPVVA